MTQRMGIRQHNLPPQHLIIVRHGESEGDARRAAWKRGETVPATKLPEHEEVTALGLAQSRRAGQWIQQHILKAYGLEFFDGCYVSSALRSEQSAVALELPRSTWQEDNCLDERGRGLIRGIKAEQHRKLYPRSFEQMQQDPLHWTPPGGEALIPDVSSRVRQFLTNISYLQNVLAVTHRDWMWAAQMDIEHLSEAELLAVDTDQIHNAQVVEYASIDPETGAQAPVLLWKRTVGPAAATDAGQWQVMSNVAEFYRIAA